MSTIEKIVIEKNGSEKTYVVTANGREVRTTAKRLMSQTLFAHDFLSQTDRLWDMIPDYSARLGRAFEKAIIIEISDLTEDELLLASLFDFVHEKSVVWGEDGSVLAEGKVLWTEDGQEAWFKFDQFLAYLARRGPHLRPALVKRKLTSLGIFARLSTKVGKTMVRPYTVNLEQLEKKIEAADGD